MHMNEYALEVLVREQLDRMRKEGERASRLRVEESAWTDGQTMCRGAVPDAEELVERYAERVYRLAQRLTGDHDDAEDIVEAVLGTAIGADHAFASESAFVSWLDRAVAHAAYRALRRRPPAREIAMEDVVPPLDSDGQHFERMHDWSKQVDDPRVRSELRDVLSAAVEELPADYRIALILYDVEGIPNTDIAEVLGVDLLTVRSCVHRARLFVRNRLTEYFDHKESQACQAK